MKENIIAKINRKNYILGINTNVIFKLSEDSDECHRLAIRFNTNTIQDYEKYIKTFSFKKKDYCFNSNLFEIFNKKIKEIIDIQEKLHSTIGRQRKKAAIGIYPLEEIKLPITYKALDPNKIKFQPLEFPSEITGKQILSQHSAVR